MPILTPIGRRTAGGRLTVAGIYVLLIAGGATMVYPFLLMVSTALTGETDYQEFRVVPRYLYDDEARYAKFLAEKYQRLGDLKALRGEALRGFDDAAEGFTSTPDAHAAAAARDWYAYERTLHPRDFGVWHVGRRSMPGKAEMRWRDFLGERLCNDVQRLTAETGRAYRSFSEVFAPYEQPTVRLWFGVPGREGELWHEFKKGLGPAFRRPIDGRALWHQWLYRTYERVDDLNRALGTSFDSFESIPLPPTRLDAGPLAEEWARFVRLALPYHTVAVRGGDDAYRAFLAERFGDTATLNRSLGTAYASPADVHWPPAAPTPEELNAASVFVQSVDPAELTIATPDVRFVEHLQQKYGGDVAALNNAWRTSLSAFADARPPYAAEDAVEFVTDRGKWMTWFLTRNFSEVISFIAVRGRSLQNTAILVIAMILAALTVNPLAAYALSRFELSYTNQVLVFLLATMAFPYEVTMIPGFLLLRHFPLWAGGAALLAGGGALLWMLRRGGGRRVWLAVLIALAAGGLAASLTARAFVWWYGSADAASISLLNTYAALILPGVASGYSIFLLKGFFDSLPEELFEAARLDGAGEMRMLWQIAVPLCKPILAVIMLFTFTATYGSYIWALVVCQDERMWTLMVHLFQLQQWAPTYVTMAANVIASLPTLLVFIVAQNMIMRGVIIPAYK